MMKKIRTKFKNRDETTSFMSLYKSDKLAIIDTEDIEKINNYASSYHIDSTGYPRAGSYRFLHRLINNTPAGMETDHINRNKLDNRKSNLRTSTHKENMNNRNLPIIIGTAKGYTKKGNKFQVQLSTCGKTNYHGLFETEELAKNKVKELLNEN